MIRRRCARCQRAFQVEEDEYHCKPCLRHYMPYTVEQTIPTDPTKQVTKGRSIGQILKSGKERREAKEVLGNL